MGKYKIISILILLLIFGFTVSADAQNPPLCSYPHVPKKNGTYDQRKNDLWELANDWVFFRGKILKKTADGDSKGAQQARQDFQQTNAWLSEYPESQVSEALALAEKCRSGK